MIVLAILLTALAQAPLPPGHPNIASATPAPSADELVKRLDATPGLDAAQKSFEIAASLCRLFAGEGRFAESRRYGEQALALASEARAFYLAHRRAGEVLPEASAIGCGRDETLAANFARAKTKRGIEATACARAALRALPDVEVLYGNALFLTGNARAALDIYAASLAVFPDNHAARYAHGALLLDLESANAASTARAREDLQRFIDAEPQSLLVPQARRLLGEAWTRAQATHASTDSEELNATLERAENALAAGKFDEARSAYLGVMVSHSDDPRLRAGLAWTMIKLNRQPMAETVWRVAIADPTSISALVDRLRSKGDVEGATALAARLAAAAPTAR